MKEIKFLPLCYSFSFDIETVTLFLKIQKWLIPELQDQLRDDIPIMDYMYKTYGGEKSLFANFGEKEKPFGWNDSIVWYSETDDEIIYSLSFVPVEIPTQESCPKCRGKKTDFLGHECYECHGTGKKHVPNNKHFGNGMLSLYPIILLLNWALLEQCGEKQEHYFAPKTDKKQLVAMEWSDTTGMHNCSISAWFDDSVFEWIKLVPDSDVKIVTGAMQKVEEVLLSKKVDAYYFRFSRYSEDTFGLQVPGNACDLSATRDSLGMFGSIGISLYPHNVDNRFQQVEFIVGLAVINDFVEKYIQGLG